MRWWRLFSWLQAFVAPFVVAHRGTFWHDTVALVIPPSEVPIDISYIPDPEYKSMVIGLTFGTPHEYDPSTGTVGPEIISTDAGVYHSTRDWMDWHWDPFVESILKTNPYPQLLWASREKPYHLRVINRTGKYIWAEVTFWVIKFPKRIPCPFWGECDPEDLFRRYMDGVVKLFTAISALGEAGVLKALEALSKI